MRIEDRLKTNNFRDGKHKLIVSMFFLSYRIRNNLNVMLKKNNLSIEQFNVLRILKGSGTSGLSVKEIAERIIETNSNVPRIIDKLEKKEYILRKSNPSDKRITNVTITTKAVDLLDKIKLDHINIEEKSLPLSEEECNFVNKILENSF